MHAFSARLVVLGVLLDWSLLGVVGHNSYPERTLPPPTQTQVHLFTEGQARKLTRDHSALYPLIKNRRCQAQPPPPSARHTTSDCLPTAYCYDHMVATPWTFRQAGSAPASPARSCPPPAHCASSAKHFLPCYVACSRLGRVCSGEG